MYLELTVIRAWESWAKYVFLSAGFVWSFICGYLLIPTLAQAFLSYSIKAEFKMDRWQPFICKKGLLWIQSVTHSFEGSFFATKGLGHHSIKYDDDVRLFQQFVKKGVLHTVSKYFYKENLHVLQKKIFLMCY